MMWLVYAARGWGCSFALELRCNYCRGRACLMRRLREVFEPCLRALCPCLSWVLTAASQSSPAAPSEAGAFPLRTLWFACRRSVTCCRGYGSVHWPLQAVGARLPCQPLPALLLMNIYTYVYVSDDKLDAGAVQLLQPLCRLHKSWLGHRRCRVSIATHARPP